MTNPFATLNTETKLSLILGFIVIGVTLATYALLPPQIPLWYSLPQASEQIADRMYIAIIPLSTSFVLAVHFVLLSRLHWLDQTLRRLIGVSSVFVVCLLAIVLVHILTAVL